MSPGHPHSALRSNSLCYVVTYNVELVERLQPTSDTIFDFQPGHTMRIYTIY